MQMTQNLHSQSHPCVPPALRGLSDPGGALAGKEEAAICYSASAPAVPKAQSPRSPEARPDAILPGDPTAVTVPPRALADVGVQHSRQGPLTLKV